MVETASVECCGTPRAEAEKKAYQAPKLTVWGSVRDLTQGEPVGSVSDFPLGITRPLE